MFVEPFASGRTWIHALDPRLRICTALFFSCALATATTAQEALSGLSAALLLLLCSRPPLRPLLRRLAAVNVFLLFLWLTVPFSTPGPAVFHIGPFTCTLTGLHLVWLVSLKANAITLLFIACVASMSIAQFGHALHCLHVPEKFVFLLLFTYRSLFLLADEWQRLNIALRLHNFIAATNLRTYRTMGSLIGLTLVRSLDRAGRIHQAMLLRGFDGTFSSLAEFHLSRSDFLFLAIMLVLFVLSLCV